MHITELHIYVHFCRAKPVEQLAAREGARITCLCEKLAWIDWFQTSIKDAGNNVIT